MNTTNEYIPAGTNTIRRPNTYEEVIREMIMTTEETFELSIKARDRNVFWFLYLTDKLSDNWGITLMIGNRIILDLNRRTKWWKKY